MARRSCFSKFIKLLLDDTKGYKVKGVAAKRTQKNQMIYLVFLVSLDRPEFDIIERPKGKYQRVKA